MHLAHFLVKFVRPSTGESSLAREISPVRETRETRVRGPGVGGVVGGGAERALIRSRPHLQFFSNFT